MISSLTVTKCNVTTLSSLNPKYYLRSRLPKRQAPCGLRHPSGNPSGRLMGSGVERIDPLRFLAGCHKRRINQMTLSLCLVSLAYRFFECVLCCSLRPFFCVALFLHCALASCGAVYYNRSCLWVCDSGLAGGGGGGTGGVRTLLQPARAQRLRLSERFFHVFVCVLSTGLIWLGCQCK